MNAKGWAENEIRAIVAMKRAGYSSEEIGNMIGRSRNAVIGKLHRLANPDYSPRPAKTARKVRNPPPLKKRSPKFVAWKPNLTACHRGGVSRAEALAAIERRVWHPLRDPKPAWLQR